MHIPIIIVAVIIFAGVGLFLFSSTDATDTESSIARIEDTEHEITIETTNDDTERDGDDDVEEENSTEEDYATETTEVRAASASYLTPSRTEHTVDVSVTLTGSVITDVEVLFDGQPEGQFSNSNQGRFYNSYSSEVVGKSIEDISLSRVGGASLTSNAFNEAVQSIASEV